ncbi:two-pore potassium channel 1-like [Amaranthus tricolor]|uniref:two-pore potassium channel 1-like n=1 Tax=Amaranthus tricolor TaxID=29722 RepID=UPI00258896D0|nr:two-pore potassium channel 1-like [Amaranthus tricolor]
MAEKDDPKTPLLENPINDPATKHNEQNNVLARRRFQRTKTTPGSQNKPSPELQSPTKKPILLQVFVALTIYLGAGTLSFVLIIGQLEGKKTNKIVDALYFCVVTMTTVGYGDLVPATTLAKLLACLFVFSGMIIVGMVLSKAADYIVEKNEALVAKAFHLRDKVTPVELLKEVETNKTVYKFTMASIVLVLLMSFGTLFLMGHEEMSFIDAFYCVCATITTLGYGDESFGTVKGRVFGVFWILSSTICLGQFFFYLTEVYTERTQRYLLKWVLSRKFTLDDIEAADLDHDNVVSAAEFIILKLKEMEKITEEDVSVLMECFRNLDVDDSGTLTEADII